MISNIRSSLQHQHLKCKIIFIFDKYMISNVILSPISSLKMIRWEITSISIVKNSLSSTDKTCNQNSYRTCNQNSYGTWNQSFDIKSCEDNKREHKTKPPSFGPHESRTKWKVRSPTSRVGIYETGCVIKIVYETWNQTFNNMKSMIGKNVNNINRLKNEYIYIYI